MSYDVDEQGKMLITPADREALIKMPLLSKETVQTVINARRNAKHKERKRAENGEKPQSAARQAASYLSFGRTRLRKMIQHQQHATGLMLKTNSPTILTKRQAQLAAGVVKTSEQMAAEKAAATLTIRPKRKHGRRRGK